MMTQAAAVLLNKKSMRRLTMNLSSASSSGFTLVELLAVITIIGILSVLAMGAYRGAQKDTMAAKTRGTISKIEAILNERIDDYLSKPLKFDATGAAFVADFPVENRVSPNSPNKIAKIAPGVATGLLRERVRIAAIRDLMRMEMPDCVGDLFLSGYPRNATMASMLTHANPPVPLVTGYRLGPAPGTALLMRLEPPNDFMRILQRVHQADLKLHNLGRTREARVVDAIDPSSGSVTSIAGGLSRWADEYPNEELLYMIVESTFVGTSPAIEAFGASEISDKDNDGLPEFVDAWGNPIRWLRWPSGINSVAPTNPDPLNVNNPVGTDAFDPTQADIGYDPINDPTGNSLANAAYPGFFPRPLVISAGADGRFGLRFYPVDPSTGKPSPSFSPSRVQLPTSPAFRGPAYWPTNFNWPDPFNPRALTSVNVNDILRYRPGAVLTSTFVSGDPVIDDLVGDPIGVDIEVTPLRYIANPKSDDQRYSVHTSDNVSNLDEAGASL